MDVCFEHARLQAKKKLNFQSDNGATWFKIKFNMKRIILFFISLFTILILWLSFPSSNRNISDYTLSSATKIVCTDHIFPGGRVPVPDGSRVIVLADVHGDYKKLTSTLVSVGLVNSDAPYHWQENNHDILVLLGDIVDRGPDTKTCLQAIMTWSTQAQRNGGRVVPLLGNHELMAMTDVTRYVSKKDFKSFGGISTRKHAFEPNGMFGAWLRCWNIAVVVGNDVYVHAGLLPKWLSKRLEEDSNEDEERVRARVRVRRGSIEIDSPLEAINDNSRRALMEEDYDHELFKSKGPLWDRYFARGTDTQDVCYKLDKTLYLLNATRMVVGHTRQHIAVGIRCEGRLLLLDTGMSQAYDSNPAALVVHFDSDSTSTSEIIYPAINHIRKEKRVHLHDLKAVKLHHEILVEEHRLSTDSDQLRRQKMKRDFILHRDHHKNKLRHERRRRRRRRK
jgi:hypothetical protein